MGVTTDLLTHLAEHLAADGVAVWRPAGPYLSTETAIFFASVPDQPGNAVTLTGYSLGDDPQFGDTVLGVQVRTRTAGQDPVATDDLADAVFASLHGYGPANLPNGRRLQHLGRTSSVVIGQDDSQRWSRSDNYHAQLHAPAPHRL